MLVAVCGDRLESANQKKATKAIGKCSWPRALTFSIPLVVIKEVVLAKSKTVVVDGNEAATVEAGSIMSLHITSPNGFRGTYTLPSSSWGAPSFSCLPPESPHEIKVLESDMLFGCKYDKKKKPQFFTRSHIVLVKRGSCSFTDKAMVATLAGAGGIIIANEKNEVLDEMPKGEAKTDKIDIPVLSVAKVLGEAWLDALMYSIEPITGYLGCAGQPNAFESKEVSEIAPRKNMDDMRGSLLVVGKRPTKMHGYEFAWAHFGPVPQESSNLSFFPDDKSNPPIRVVAAEPMYGCEASKYVVKITDFVVAVMRGGGCTFGDKAAIAIKLGAAAIIIVDDDTKGNEKDRPVMRLMAAEDQAEELDIRTVMTVHSFWKDSFGMSFRDRKPGDLTFVTLKTLPRS